MLSTPYGLNSFYTKRIHVGLQSSNSDEFDFHPVVKLAGKENKGIFFLYSDMKQFQANMLDYLDGSNRRMLDYFDGSNIKSKIRLLSTR